jgi:phosphatidate cytidylyltransferase
MNSGTWQRLFGFRHGFDDPGVVLIFVLLGLGLVIAPLVILGLDRAGRLTGELKADLWRRYRSWTVMIPAIAVPILLGAFWTILAVCVLSILCFREFARTTGFFREKLMNLIVVLGIVALALAAVDHWYRLFVALTPIVIVLISAVSTSLDRPKGYIQRVGMAALSFLLFGTCLGHLGYMANDTHYRSLLLLLVFSVGLNDVFAYGMGKVIGGPKLAPQTSPNKTVAGAVGAVVLTTLLVFGLGGSIFRESPMKGPVFRLVLGLLISIAGQLGDLTVSAIKRDVGVKETGVLIPGHGGILDRANSLLLSTPAMFHYLNYFHTIGGDQTINIFTSGR